MNAFLFCACLDNFWENSALFSHASTFTSYFYFLFLPPFDSSLGNSHTGEWLQRENEEKKIPETKASANKMRISQMETLPYISIDSYRSILRANHHISRFLTIINLCLPLKTNTNISSKEKCSVPSRSLQQKTLESTTATTIRKKEELSQRLRQRAQRERMKK